MNVQYILLASMFCLFMGQQTSTNPICSTTNCPTNRGLCFNDSCFCFESYATFNKDPTQPFFYCGYLKYNRWLPFFLELFLPSIGHFAVGNNGLGFIKLILFIASTCSCCCAVCVVALCCQHNRDRQKAGLAIYYLITGLIFFFFYVKDLIYYGCAWYTDGNGIPLI